MAQMKIDKAIKIRALGKWQQPILEAVKKGLPGSKVGYKVLPAGRAGLIVYWNGFDRHDIPDRQKTVRDVMKTLGPDVAKLVPLIVALTPEEAAGLDEEL